MQAAVAATPPFAFQAVTASPTSPAAFGTGAAAMNDTNSTEKVTTRIEDVIDWVIMIQSPHSSCGFVGG
jgi:hypothetical protein